MYAEKSVLMSQIQMEQSFRRGTAILNESQLEQSSRRESLSNDRVDQLFDAVPSRLELTGLKNILDRQSRELSFYQKQSILEAQQQALPEVVTIEKMESDVKQIFVKIVEQLEDPLHPLARICKEFQNQYIKDIYVQMQELNLADEPEEAENFSKDFKINFSMGNILSI